MEEGLSDAYVNIPAPTKGDYYADSSGRKVGDFVLGFFGIYVFTAMAGILIFIMAGPLGLERSAEALFFVLAWGIGILFLILAIGAIILGFKKDRRYISIGILSSLAVPGLIFGACWVVILSVGF